MLLRVALPGDFDPFGNSGSYQLWKLGNPTSVSLVQLGISGVPAETNSGDAFTATVAAEDSGGQTLTDISDPVLVAITDANGINIASFPGAFANGQFQFSVPQNTLINTGSEPITDTLTITADSITQQLSIVVDPASLGNFSIGLSGTPAAGKPFTVFVYAFDANLTYLPDFSGPVSVQITDPEGNMVDSVIGNFSNGAFSFDVAGLASPSANPIQYTITASSGPLTQSTTFNVFPFAQFVETAGDPTSVYAGRPFDFGIVAEDAGGNALTDYTGQVYLYAYNPNTGDYIFSGYQPITAADQGQHVFQNLEPQIPGTYTVYVSDAAGANFSTFTLNVSAAPPPASVVGRSIFYNDSYFDGNDAGANAADDGSIATDKQALLPGATATFANYTSYSRGINGIMVDIANLAGTPTVDDFIFKVGDDNNPAGWNAAPDPTSITVRPGAGANGSDRVTILWDNNAIQNEWLQVTVKANTSTTGLSTPDVFYFGNAIGETGNSDTNTFVDGTDFAATRDNQRNFLNRAPDRLCLRLQSGQLRGWHRSGVGARQQHQLYDSAAVDCTPHFEYQYRKCQYFRNQYCGIEFQRILSDQVTAVSTPTIASAAPSTVLVDTTPTTTSSESPLAEVGTDAIDESNLCVSAPSAPIVADPSISNMTEVSEATSTVGHQSVQFDTAPTASPSLSPPVVAGASVLAVLSNPSDTTLPAQTVAAPSKSDPPQVSETISSTLGTHSVQIAESPVMIGLFASTNGSLVSEIQILSKLTEAGESSTITSAAIATSAVRDQPQPLVGTTHRSINIRHEARKKVFENAALGVSLGMRYDGVIDWLADQHTVQGKRATASKPHHQ